MDIYAFGTILVELAEWQSLKTIVSKHLVLRKDTPTEEVAQVKRYLLHQDMAFRMGDIYSAVAIRCLSGQHLDIEAETTGDCDALMRQNFYHSVVRELEKCIL